MTDLVALPHRKWLSPPEKIASMAEEVANEAFEQRVFEDFVEERVKAGQGIFGLYPPGEEAAAEFAAWRQKEGR